MATGRIATDVGGQNHGKDGLVEVDEDTTVETD